MTQVVFIFGTTAEAIKIAPVARRLEARGVEYELWLTLQHTDALLAILPSLGLPTPTRIIAGGKKGEPLRGVMDVFRWGGEILAWVARDGWALRRTSTGRRLVIVHGDTITSVVGALIGRFLKAEVAHIEAGLRSGNWRHPFPEELDRRIVGRLATIHYAPSEDAARNLQRRPNVVHTHGNTALDAVLDMKEITSSSPTETYAVVLLHRFEFLTNRALVDRTLAILGEASPVQCYFFVDEFAKETLADLLPTLTGRIVVQGKKPHDEFVRLLRGAQFIVTDSGGTQAEAALIGVPTLIHRRATEQFEGMDRNIVLSEWHDDKLRRFLSDYESLRHDAGAPDHSPSDVIVDDLRSRGLVR